MADQSAETAQIIEALREAFSGDEFEENAEAAAGEGEWSWFRWLAVSTVEDLTTSAPEEGAVVADRNDEQGRMTDSERGLRFRIDVACLGYRSLTDDDVPQEYIGTELDAYKEGAADAARAIQSEMRLPPDEGSRRG